jgi:O-antigen/teichoic acid export membrane protein
MQPTSLTRRTFASLRWTVLGSTSSMVILFVRSIVLARLLPVETFGTVALASAWVVLTVSFATFGMGSAFLHRAPESENEETTAAIHLSLKLIFTGLWAGVMIACAFIFATGEMRTALVVLVGAQAVQELAQTPSLILKRRVQHRRLASLTTIQSLIAAVVSIGLALAGADLWALLIPDVIGALIEVSIFYLWRPVWRPRLAWNLPQVRYFLRFGSRTFVAGLLTQSLDKVDDIWTGTFLGQTGLGYYSRAYAFAAYQRAILGQPVNLVMGGSFAELKFDRARLSRAFMRTISFMVRIGFLISGILAVTAPELIRILLGEKWMPMLEAFRLMLLFTLFDPIKLTIADVYIAVGIPGRLVRVRSIQLVVLVIGLFALGPRYGIGGVALSVNVMLVVGMALLFGNLRDYVDFSLRAIFSTPVIGLAAGLLATTAAATLLLDGSPDWVAGGVKLALFSICYLGALWLLERNRPDGLFAIVRQYLRFELRKTTPPAQPKQRQG